MNICMISSTPFPPEDGIGYHIFNISKKLIQNGHKVTIITRGKLKKTDKISFNNIDIYHEHYIPLYPFHVFIHGFYVNKLIKKIQEDFDLIHVHTPLSPIIHTKLPLINTIHSSIIEDSKHIEMVNIRSYAFKLQANTISKYLIKNLILNSNLTTTVSNSMLKELASFYNIHNVKVIGNGVDEKTFVPSNNEDDSILFVGRLSYRKGLFDLLNAFEALQYEYSIKLRIIGKGELHNIFKNWVDRKGLSNKVEFLGHISRAKLIREYQKTKIFIMPSQYETGPLTLLEAMSCGKPVISTSVGIAPDVIENFSNGILIPINSPNSILNSLITLLNDEKLRDELGKNARKTVQEKYTGILSLVEF